jgi:DNA-directed RNA polymerase specialized sigma24 family protein
MAHDAPCPVRHNPGVPTPTAPPLNEDFRLVEALQAQRPGAVGHVYNVYGPELVEYAEALLGDHARAVEAVREALLTLRDAEVPDVGTFRDWLYELVRDRCKAAPARRRGPLVMIGGAAAAVALTGGMLALFESTDREPSPSAAPPVAMNTPASPTPSATPTPSPTPKDEKKPEKAAKPAKKHKTGPGRLSVNDSGCQGVRAAGLPTQCFLRLTATGGAVKWSVTSVRDRAGRISAGGSGTLAAGRSTSVAVTVRPTVLCYIGGRGSGTVSFSPGGTATVSYTCWRR